jgi:hypothetical protein
MNDWNLWLSSSETRQAIKLLNEELHELEQTVIDGALLLHDKADKIAVDYAHKVGAVEGLRKAIMLIKDIKEYLNKDGESEDERV